MAFKSLLLGGEIAKHKKHIVTSQVEHKCVFAITEYLMSIGYEVTFVQPNTKGVITADSIENAIRPDTALVSVMHVNNELGTINPIGDIGKICFERAVLFHSDAAQSFGKIDIDVDDLNVDVMSFSAHKIGGPKGIGAIYIRDLRKRNLTPVIHGAGQEEGLRGGTVAAPLISGFGQAITMFPEAYEKLTSMHLKEEFISSLKNANIEFVINGDSEKSLPHIISVTFPKIDLPLFIRKNENFFCLAQGSACSSKEIEISHVLSSLGLNSEMGERTLRLSFSHFNTLADIGALVGDLRVANVH
jgi:cysteine desulfurase